MKAIIACKGKVIVTGMGKSGLIGKKIAATLASTGTPSFFLHPGEAYHGDLGMIEPQDIVLAIANSGQTDEILKLIPFLQYNKNVVIAMTGNPESTLAKHAHYHLNIAVAHEACPLDLGAHVVDYDDAGDGRCAGHCADQRTQLQSGGLRRVPSGGSLGRRLLTKVQDVMRKDNLPCVPKEMTLGNVIIAISDARLGIAAVVEEGKLIGVITDGDVRRAMAKYKENFFNIEAQEVMTRTPKTILPTERIVVAEEMMRNHKIHSIVVTDEQGHVVGIVEFFNVSVMG